MFKRPRIQDNRDTYTYLQGNPVPDGMVFSHITKQNCPPNIAAIEAGNIVDATREFLHAVRHGAQGGVWLTDTNLRFIEGDDAIAKAKRDTAVDAYVLQQEASLTEGMADIFRSVHGRRTLELQSKFNPHGDNALAPSDYVWGRNGNTIRLVTNFDGIGTVNFGRNIVLAEKLMPPNWEYPKDVAEYGPAYISPPGSVTFLVDGLWGLCRASIHSSPHVPAREDKAPVRDIAVTNCFYNF